MTIEITSDCIDVHTISSSTCISPKSTNLKISVAGKLYKARSRLYRSQILQVNTRWNVCNTLYDSPALFFRRQEQRPLFCAIGALCFSGPKNKGARSDAFLTNQSISEWIDRIQRTLSAASAPSLRGGEVREIRKLHLGRLLEAVRREGQGSLFEQLPTDRTCSPACKF